MPRQEVSLTTDELLDRLVMPRPSGSEEVGLAARTIEEALRPFADDVHLQSFVNAPYRLESVMLATFALMLGYAVAVWRRRYLPALAIVLAALALQLLEMEWLLSPLSGVVETQEKNVIGVFHGRAGGPRLVLSAHYDTATQFGDHHTWTVWGYALSVAVMVAIGLAIAGWWRRRRNEDIPRAVTAVAIGMVIIPASAMALFFAAGPRMRAPSPGALDNAGSVVALLRVAEHLAARPAEAPTTVELVFFAAEEQGALGSWHYVRSLAPEPSMAVVNLDVVGASDRLAFAPEERFPLARHRPPRELVRLLSDTAQEVRGEPLASVPWPGMSLSDARSFLAHGVPAVTVFSPVEEGLPRALHSAADERSRLSTEEIERTAAFLERLVARVDADPSLLGWVRPPDAAVPPSPGSRRVAALGRIEPRHGIIYLAGPPRPSVVVEKLFVEEGDPVHRRDVIALLAGVGLQKAEVARLEAELANAEREVERNGLLKKRGVLPESTWEAITLARDVARANLDRAQADLELSRVRSPIDGKVLEIHAREGERVGMEGIAELGDVSAMYAVAEVYETDIGRVRAGQRATIRSPALPHSLEGTVERIGLKIGKKDVLSTDPVADADARVVEVHVRLDEPELAASLTNLRVEVLIEPR